MADDKKEPQPTWAWHDTEAPNGQKFADKGDVPKGWVDTPAKLKGADK